MVGEFFHLYLLGTYLHRPYAALGAVGIDHHLVDLLFPDTGGVLSHSHCWPCRY